LVTGTSAYPATMATFFAHRQQIGRSPSAGGASSIKVVVSAKVHLPLATRFE
jgi:hypothetical protein